MPNKSNEILTENQKKEIQKLIDEIILLSMDVVSDYSGQTSELSGSVVQFHENSPLLQISSSK
jgi:hypothetical protein